MAPTATAPDWWTAYDDVLQEPFLALIRAEDRATRISTYETQILPGLVQTPSYAYAIMTATRPADADWGVRLRTTRQQILHRPAPPTYHAVIAEAALHHPAGDPEYVTAVMAEQYRHLLDLAARPTCTIQVLAGDTPVDPHGDVPFVLVETSDGRRAHAGILAQAFDITDTDDVGRYADQFAAVARRALPPHDSVDLIRGLVPAF
jgi:hypothetical protein